jgi:hypothetical protein
VVGHSRCDHLAAAFPSIFGDAVHSHYCARSIRRWRPECRASDTNLGREGERPLCQDCQPDVGRSCRREGVLQELPRQPDSQGEREMFTMLYFTSTHTLTWLPAYIDSRGREQDAGIPLVSQLPDPGTSTVQQRCARGSRSGSSSD